MSTTSEGQGQGQGETREFTDVIKPVPKEEKPKEVTSSAADIDATITGGKEWSPLLTLLNDAQIRDIREHAPLNQFTLEVDGKPKTYQRKKIKAKDYGELEQLRAKYAAAPAGYEKSRLSMEVYQRALFYYLGMTAEEFELCDFEEAKKIIDAQNVRTIYGVPNSKTS